MTSDLQFATVITRDYYCFAKTWADSVRHHYPDSKISICIADNVSQPLRRYFSDFTVVEIEKIAERDLQIDNYRRMAFQYTPFELTCALKPFVLNHLAGEANKLIYMDADTLLFDRLESIENLLNESDIVLTPHLTQPMDRSTEHRIRSAGTVNGGFVGLNCNQNSSRFLRWWRERCKSDCYVDSLSGRFVDQTWLEFANSLFEKVNCDPRRIAQRGVLEHR